MNCLETIPKKIHLWDVNGFVKISDSCRASLEYLIKKQSVRSLSKKLDVGSVVYVIRIKRGDKKVCLAKPCKTCIVKMRARGVKKIYYSISEDENGNIKWRSLTL